MNLGKLLGVGKSFFGGDPTIAYRLNKRRCLPKFNEGRNPFSPKTAQAQEVEQAAAKPSPAAPIAPAAPVVSATPKAELKVTKTTTSGVSVAQAVAMAEQTRMKKEQVPYAFKPLAKPSAQPTAKTVIQPQPQPAAKQSRPGWTTRLNPFRPPEPVAPPVEQQTELSLDSVKVVHNDLADADVDVVPIKAHTEPTPPSLPPARQAWEYLGENLLKSS